MAPKSVTNSVNSGLSMATSPMNLVRVTPVVSQTSSNTGALVLVSIVSGSANRVVVVVVVDWEMEVDSFDGAKAAPELMVANNARNESFMVTTVMCVVVAVVESVCYETV